VVQPGTALFTIVDPSSMRLEGSIAARELMAVSIGDPVHFEVTGAVDVALSTRGQRPEIEVRVDRPLASSLGVSVARSPKRCGLPLWASTPATGWIRPAKPATSSSAWPPKPGSGRLTSSGCRSSSPAAHRLPGGEAGGGAPPGPAVLPLKQIAAVRSALGPAQIQHLNGGPGDLRGREREGRSLGEVSADAIERVNALDLPGGYRITQGGEVEDQQQVFIDVFAALGLDAADAARDPNRLRDAR
jgi:HAE1 family hydrophobic/amphiphilic exporter-1